MEKGPGRSQITSRGPYIIRTGMLMQLSCVKGAGELEPRLNLPPSRLWQYAQVAQQHHSALQIGHLPQIDVHGLLVQLL